MKKIGFIIPYFGKLPLYTQVWLDSCAANPSIDWLLFTNDRAEYEYPGNVHTFYMEFTEMQSIIRSKYEFVISLETPYKLCDYKIAYGELFEEYLQGYDYWGFCDIDLIWGNIRHFYTEQLLTKYEKIGNQGHATIFKNSKDVNQRYKTILQDDSYIKAFTTNNIMCTDVVLIKKIYEYLGIPVFTEAIYAGLEKYEPGFYLQAKPNEEAWKNRWQVFLWEKGNLYRYYLRPDQSIGEEEYLYIHFFCRPMKNCIENMDRILIYPDKYINYYNEITTSLLKRYGRKSSLAYYIRVAKQNRKRISLKKVISYFKIKKEYEAKK